MPSVPDGPHAQADREVRPLPREHATELRAVKTFRPRRAPDVLVDVDGDWCQGELRAWQ